MEIIDYETRGGKNVILDYIDKLDVPTQAVAYKIRKDITEKGLVIFDVLDTRKLRGKLWEIRFLNQRIMYIIRDEEAVYFLHMCKKEKQKAQKNDLDLAIKRAKEAGYKV